MAATKGTVKGNQCTDTRTDNKNRFENNMEHAYSAICCRASDDDTDCSGSDAGGRQRRKRTDVPADPHQMREDFFAMSANRGDRLDNNHITFHLLSGQLPSAMRESVR